MEKKPQRVRYLYFRDKFFRSALQKGERKRGACMPLISQSIPVAIGSDRPKKGEREMSIGKERWERNPEATSLRYFISQLL